MGIDNVANDTAAHSSSAFRGSGGSTRDRLGSAIIMIGNVVDVDSDRWLCKVRSCFGRRLIPDVQVGSSYLHYEGGEGSCVMPELGARVAVVLPSDGSQPFVGWFLAPMEVAGPATELDPVTGVAKSPADPTGTGRDTPVDAVFAAGRPRTNPGDQVLRGRGGHL